MNMREARRMYRAKFYENYGLLPDAPGFKAWARKSLKTEVLVGKLKKVVNAG